MGKGPTVWNHHLCQIVPNHHLCQKACGKFLTTWTGPAKKSAHDVNKAIYGWSHTLAAAGKVYISKLWVVRCYEYETEYARNVFFFEKWQIPNNFADLIAVKPPSSLMSGIKMSALSTQVCRVNFPADSTIFPWLATRATTTSSCDHPAKMGHCLSTSSDDMTPSSLKT